MFFNIRNILLDSLNKTCFCAEKSYQVSQYSRKCLHFPYKSLNVTQQMTFSLNFNDIILQLYLQNFDFYWDSVQNRSSLVHLLIDKRLILNLFQVNFNLTVASPISMGRGWTKLFYINSTHHVEVRPSWDSMRIKLPVRGCIMAAVGVKSGTGKWKVVGG